jgi:hypothetical protein
LLNNCINDFKRPLLQADALFEKFRPRFAGIAARRRHEKTPAAESGGR